MHEERTEVALKRANQEEYLVRARGVRGERLVGRCGMQLVGTESELAALALLASKADH